MKAKVNSTGRFLGLACIASWLAIQAWWGPQYSHRDSQQPFEHDWVAANSIGAMSPLFDRDNVSKEKAAEVFGGLPLGFEANHGQADRQVKYLSRVGNLYLTAKEAVVNLRGSRRPSSHEGKPHSANADPQSCTLRMKLVGASDATRITPLEELPGKTNYFIGNDPKKWRTNVPTYSSVKFQSVYPGVDMLYYGNRRELEYDFIVAPGASFNPIALAFEGARRIRLDASGDLLIDTPIGEIRQHKPLIYQQANGVKEAISGRYVMRGEREVGFEVGDYDPSRTVVIDPVLVYSTSIGGFYNDSANAVAVDAAGNAYVTGMTTSLDFPTVNPFQPSLKIGTAIGIPSDAFVAKLSPSGTALIYSTYLGGGSVDAANGIAVDAEGNAYVTGYAASGDFPTTPDAFQIQAVSGGSAFVTKLNSTGNALVYSTYLGAPGSNNSFSPFTANVGMSVAVDAEGNAYSTGYTLSARFPLKRPAQDQFNRGTAVNCCPDCFHSALPFLGPLEDAFVTKLNPSGTGLVYSTYLGGTGEDEAYGIAVDAAGSAYVITVYAGLGNCGKPGGVLKSTDGGITWKPTGLTSGLVQTIAVDPKTPSTLYAGGSKSTDGGNTWRPPAFFAEIRQQVIDPKTTTTVYLVQSGLNCGDTLLPPFLLRSTDGGNTWNQVRNGTNPFGADSLVIDPKNPSTLYATSGNLFKSTDAVSPNRQRYW